MRWKFWQKAPTAFADELRRLTEWEADKSERGFHSWLYQSPPRGSVIEIARREWPTSQIVDVADMLPEMNVADLWWRECSGAIIDGRGPILEIAPEKAT